MHVKHITTKTTTRQDKRQYHKQQNMNGDLLWISNHANKYLTSCKEMFLGKAFNGK